MNPDINLVISILGVMLAVLVSAFIYFQIKRAQSRHNAIFRDRRERIKEAGRRHRQGSAEINKDFAFDDEK